MVTKSTHEVRSRTYNVYSTRRWGGLKHWEKDERKVATRCLLLKPSLVQANKCRPFSGTKATYCMHRHLGTSRDPLISLPIVHQYDSSVHPLIERLRRAVNTKACKLLFNSFQACAESAPGDLLIRVGTNRENFVFLYSWLREVCGQWSLFVSSERGDYLTQRIGLGCGASQGCGERS